MKTSTLKEFKAFDKLNPNVYKKFKAGANRHYRCGRRLFSAWAIMNEIRWSKLTVKGQNQFKIKNDFITLYARKLVKENSTFKTFFNLKTINFN